ncbi:hypothetical protein MesoLj113b_63950 [Mesorhizobium sp. 113-3-3]|nr:hypothetical protein MesoLj113b_63950 [Mesorhizobium sp. 113-3-3]BCG90730.1 hypothetical protein MesoLj113c_68400 [Mesorhizobium sp. 113-3-9]
MDAWLKVAAIWQDGHMFSIGSLREPPTKRIWELHRTLDPRRYWRARRRKSSTLEEKQRLVAESCESGASMSLVPQRHDINANLLFT